MITFISFRFEFCKNQNFENGRKWWKKAWDYKIMLILKKIFQAVYSSSPKCYSFICGHILSHKWQEVMCILGNERGVSVIIEIIANIMNKGIGLIIYA